MNKKVLKEIPELLEDGCKIHGFDGEVDANLFVEYPSGDVQIFSWTEEKGDYSILNIPNYIRNKLAEDIKL